MMFLFIFIIILAAAVLLFINLHPVFGGNPSKEQKKLKALTIMPMANFLIKHKKRWIWAEYPEFSQ
nr:hypothetical protein [Bacillus licheniformis]